MAAIREALRAALRTIPGCQVSAYLLANPTLPSLMITAGEVEYDTAMARGLDTWTLLVQGMVALTTDEGQQKQLDKWRASSGAESVKAAVESDRTLGGVVQDARVVMVSEDRVYGIDPNLRLGCEWTVRVLATG